MPTISVSTYDGNERALDLKGQLPSSFISWDTQRVEVWLVEDGPDMHSLEILYGSAKSYALISEATTANRTAAVFVHGFTGNAVSTWLRFQTLIDELHDQFPGFAEWDLYFYDYGSMYGNIPVLANQVVSFLRSVYPSPSYMHLFKPDFISGDKIVVRDEGLNLPVRYENLVLVGHSLGGVLLRQAILDIAAQRGYDNVDVFQMSQEDRDILDATLRLFAPAIFGFDPTHLIGYFLNFACGVPPLRLALKPLLDSNPPYKDLELKSERLQDLRRRTELLARQLPSARALRAEIVYGSEDHVVHIDRFDCDPVAEIARDQSHTSICKPTAEYQAPLRFVYGKVATTTA